jgi:hypothetical protein
LSKLYVDTIETKTQGGVPALKAVPALSMGFDAQTTSFSTGDNVFDPSESATLIKDVFQGFDLASDGTITIKHKGVYAGGLYMICNDRTNYLAVSINGTSTYRSYHRTTSDTQIEWSDAGLSFINKFDVGDTVTVTVGQGGDYYGQTHFRFHLHMIGLEE